MNNKSTEKLFFNTNSHESKAEFSQIYSWKFARNSCRFAPKRFFQQSHKKAMTLLEVLVATILLSLVMIGLGSVFLGAKKFVYHSRSRMTGGEMGKYFLDYLHDYVRQAPTSDSANDGWNQPNNPLSVGTGTRYCDGSTTPIQPGCASNDTRTLDGIRYDAKYEISNVPALPNLRKVKLTLTWEERTPP